MKDIYTPYEVASKIVEVNANSPEFISGKLIELMKLMETKGADQKDFEGVVAGYIAGVRSFLPNLDAHGTGGTGNGFDGRVQ